MSTKQSSSGGKKGAAGAQQGPGKKRRSAGFIESSDFKPNWLETGPLNPDMLPETLPIEETGLTTDEYEALQLSLQRFYAQEAADAPEAASAASVEEVGEAAPHAPTAEETSVGESESATTSEPVTESSAADEISVPTGVIPDGTPETSPPNDQPTPPPPPEAWIQPLLQNDAPSPDPARPAAWPVGGSTPADPTADTFIEPEWEPEAVEEEAVRVEEVETTEVLHPVEVEPVEAIEDIVSPVDATPMVPPPVAAETPEPRRARRTKTRRRRDRLSIGLFLLSLLLFGLAALIYFVNPFTRLALGSASLARPIASPTTATPREGSGAWCVQGEFLAASAAPLRLIDSGASGDLLAEDNIFSVEHVIDRPGSYEWRVIDCENPALAFPQGPAWITTTKADEPVTFTFDANRREDPLFFPIPYVVSATDSATTFQIVGNFQEWNPNDPTGILQPITLGLYQQVRRIARAGSYEGYVIAGNERHAVDAYGRTTEPIPFSFQTDRNGDYVVFLVDTDRGRASVMYDMPPVFTSLAFGNGYWLLSIALAGLAGFLLLGLLLRLLVVNNRRLQLEAGCPNCGRHELMRIARHSSDRLLHMLGVPAYRYRCRHCTWEGTRLSEDGAAISPGVTVAAIDGSELLR